jgi:hypothetical protein
MSYRPQPTYIEHPFNDPHVKELLPPFVCEKVQELLLESDYGDEEDEIVSESVRYAEIEGSIDHPSKDIGRQIILWIASDDTTRLHMYVGGSSCWIEPDSHSISFHAIDETLLPVQAERDASIWWIIADGRSVHRIHIVPEAGTVEDFPDL